MSKKADEVFEVTEDEGGINRLFDMDTQEVSVVDRAANQRKFLVIKRDEGEDMAKENGTLDTIDETADIETKTVEKSALSFCIEQARDQSILLRKSIEDAPEDDKGSTLPALIVKSMNLVQTMLRGVCDGRENMIAMFPSSIEVSDSISKSLKTKINKKLNEVERRLDKISKSLLEVQVIDPVQVEKIEGTCDLLGSIVVDHGPEELAKIDASSLDDAQRDKLLTEVEKALDELGGLRLALVTKSSSGEIKGADAVAGVIAKSTENLEAAGFAIVKDETGSQQIISSVRDIVKAIGGKSTEALSPVLGHVVAMAKAVSQYRVRTDWDKPEGSADKYILQEVFEPEPPKQIATFASRMAAENEAFKLKVTAVMKVAKMCEVKAGGKGYQCVEMATGKIYYDGPDKKMAQSMADRMNMSGSKKADETPKEETVATETDTKAEEGKTEKVGAPMKATRLTRLKTAVALLKDALGDLRSNKVSLEKFKKVGAELAAIINELSTLKRVNAQRDIDDKRTTKPDAPNNGAGVQPDTDSIGTLDDVAGEGAGQLAETLKALNGRLEGLEKREFQQAEEIKKKDRLIADLQASNRRLKKTRRAPATTPDEQETVKTQKGGADDDFYWPADMSNWKGD